MATVLVVDDDASLRNLLGILLRLGDHDVREAPDGLQALSLLSVEPPDLIVLDLEMPVVDGREFYARARGAGYGGPVLICSAHGARHAQRELGAEGWIDKPFDPEYLLTAVSSLLMAPARDG